MNKVIALATMMVIVFAVMGCKSPAGSENTVVQMKTSLGDITLKLYDETPLHRDNFIRLVNSGFYEGISFHRVINGFMIQAGDPSTRTVPIPPSADSLNTYTIASEFRKDLFHKKGALAAAREGNEVNPEMRSSGTHFYIVQGTVINNEEFPAAENRINSGIKQAMFNRIMRETAESAKSSGTQLPEGEIQEITATKMYDYLASNPSYTIPEEQREVYRTLGGVPRLDGTYTVFGEVVEGLDVVDRIAAVSTDEADKPLTDVKILRMKIVSK
jgi:cyclophilin family peptidyl-prolyl cis-trans isomerase